MTTIAETTLDRRLEDLRSDVLGEDACLIGPFGQRRICYADHIASGRPLASVETALRDLVLPAYANTHTEDSFTGARTTRIAHDAAAYLKGALHADDAYAVAFPGTGSTGAIKRLQEILGVAVPCTHRERFLAALPEAERLVVFVGPYEHHSNEVSWRESLAEVVAVPLDERGALDLAALEEAVSDPRYAGRPKLGSFSAASNVTGIRTDVAAVARVLRRHGARVAVDFAASAPYEDVDVRAGSDAQIDAAMISPHKFLGGPGSPGLLVFHRDLYDLRAPTTAGGGTVAYVTSQEHVFLGDIEAREDAGTPAIVQRIRAALAFQVKERVGIDAIERREHAWTEHALARLTATPGVVILGPTDVPRLAVVSFNLRDAGAVAAGRDDVALHPRFVIRLLSDLFGIQGRAGCSCAGPYGHELLGIDLDHAAAYLDAIQRGFEGIRPGWARISFHWLADRDEVDFLLDAVAFIARYGHRFLPLYRFDWHSGGWTWRDAAPAEDPATGGASAFGPESWEALPRSTRSRAEDYAAAMDDAHAWAERLGEPARPAPPPPDGVDPSLVSFRT